MKKIKKLFEQIQTMGQKISGHSSGSDHSNTSSSVSPTLPPPPVSIPTYALQILTSGCAQGDAAAMQEAADKRTKLPLWTEFIPEPKKFF